MSTPISEVKFSLYRIDDNSIIQEKDLEYDSVDENGIYTFSTTFTPTENSSFGLNPSTIFENCFGVKIFALDEANNSKTIEATDESIRDDENFSMAVRVKEEVGPTIALEKEWTHSQSKRFEATYIVQDSSTHGSTTFRPAGIKFDSLEVFIRKQGEDFIQQSLEEDKYNIYFGGAAIEDPTPGIDNDSKYKLTYIFNAPDDGLYDIKVVIKDNDENSTEFVSTINIQSTKPEIAVEPITSPTKDKEVNVKVTTKETTTIVIEYKEEKDSSFTTITKSDIPAGTHIETLNLEDGKYTIVVYCVNQYGVESDKITREVEIDSQIPVFKSVKFYRADTNVLVNFPEESLEQGIQYKIVVMVE